MTRRQMFEKLAVLTLAWPLTAWARQKRGESKDKGGGAPKGGLELVDVKSDQAKNLNYGPKTSVKKELQETRQDCAFGGEATGQLCKNCTLYSAVKEKVDGKEVGNCALFPGKVVAANYWCSTWSLKAGEKCL